MAEKLKNDFTSYELSPDEYIQGMALSDLQEKYIRGELATVAMEKINLPASPDPHLFQLQHELLRGKMLAFQALLYSNQQIREDTQEALRAKLAEKKES